VSYTLTADFWLTVYVGPRCVIDSNLHNCCNDCGMVVPRIRLLHQIFN